jgi:hypothetical protein
MDGMPDDWELQYGFDPLDPSDASGDADGDGATNLQEYQAGTVPIPEAGGIWYFDEGTGTSVADASGNGNTGTLTGGVTWAPGINGTALSFDGTGRVTVADDTSLDITDAITIAAWISPSRRATQRVLTKALYDTTDGFEIGLSNSNRTAFVRFNQGSSRNTYRANAVTTYPTDGSTWMHVAGTYDGSDIRFYINGVLETTVPAPGLVIGGNTLPLVFGAENDGTDGFSGAIDEVYIQGYALDGSYHLCARRGR